MSAQHKPGPKNEGSPRPFVIAPLCPFRTADRIKQFRGMVGDYQSHSGALWHGPAGCYENHSNNIGEAFWRGFHGKRYIWDKAAPLWVAYRSGAAIAKATGSHTP